MTKRDLVFTLLCSGLWDEKCDYYNMSPYKEMMIDAENAPY